MTGPDEPTSIQPLPEPGTDPMATLLADVLSSEAARIQPTDRLADIRTAATVRRRRWAPLAAAAAVIVVVGGGAWAALDREGQGGRPPSVGASPTPSAGRTPSATTSPSTSSPTATTGTWAAPIYYPGRNVSGLFREFHRLPVTPGAVATHIADAFRVAMDPTSPQRQDQVFSPWLVGTSTAFQVSLPPGQTLLVTLPDSEKSGRGATREQARLAVQQLVWTATAVAQDAQLGVRVGFATGTGKLFGVLPLDQTFHRPDRSYQDLSAIWILAPEPGSTVGSTVVVSGQACTLEANVAWQLLRDARVTASGHVTATSGCPVRGTWQVPLKGLVPGSYTFRAFELSPKDGTTYQGLDTTTFTVR